MTDILSSLQMIPLDSSPNQTLQTTLTVDGRNITLGITLRYNEIASYWVMTVIDPPTNEIILDSIPLITGQFPAGNILAQYSYLGIGSAYILPTSKGGRDAPDSANLGTDFVLVWGDTSE